MGIVKKISEAAPDNGAVDALRDALTRAEAGELRDVVIVGAIKDGEGAHFFRSSYFEDRWRILGAIEYAKFTVEKAD